MASPENRCLYEVLGLQRDCTADEIRSAYRKLALQRHPDKVVRSGVPEPEATAAFQELVNAYEVLSDPKERTWYDSHRSQILFSNRSSSSSSSAVPDLFRFFSNSVFSGFTDKGKGFYKVYADVFDKIYRNELNFAKNLGLGDVVKEAPLMGNLDSPDAQVNAFYDYWLGFSTVMDFAWEDHFDPMAGQSRRSRRLMEEENKKIRKKAKKEYNETVRGLAEFVKKRDKRVIAMKLKRNEEMEKKREAEKLRKKEIEREKAERAERAKAFQEPEWAKIEEQVEDELDVEEEENERKNEFYCVACGKKFKSEKQWKNHEQSKKHKEKVAELREAFGEEDRESEDLTESEDDGDEEVVVTSVDEKHFVSAADGVDQLKDQFEHAGIHEEEQGHDDQEFGSAEEEANADTDDGGKGGLKEVADELGLDGDDERSVLEAMLSGNRNWKNVETKRKPKASSKNVYIEDEIEEVDLMEYNNKKGRGRRGGRKEKGSDKKVEEPQERVEKAELSSKVEPVKGNNDGLHVGEPTSTEPSRENENNDQEETEPVGKGKVSKQAPEKKVPTKKDAFAKSKNLPKGKKQKGTKNSAHECDTCGVDFESRNKLHKHLSDTGHATLKSR